MRKKKMGDDLNEYGDNSSTRRNKLPGLVSCHSDPFLDGRLRYEVSDRKFLKVGADQNICDIVVPPGIGAVGCVISYSETNLFLELSPELLALGDRVRGGGIGCVSFWELFRRFL